MKSSVHQIPNGQREDLSSTHPSNREWKCLPAVMILMEAGRGVKLLVIPGAVVVDGVKAGEAGEVVKSLQEEV